MIVILTAFIIDMLNICHHSKLSITKLCTHISISKGSVKDRRN